MPLEQTFGIGDVEMNPLMTKLQQWIISGASPVAQRLHDREGWLLSLCWRAKLSALTSSLMLLVANVGLVVLQIYWPEPLNAKRIAVFACIPVMIPLVIVIAIFMFYYRVELDSRGLTLIRFLTRPQQVDWCDVCYINFQPGDELLKIHSQDGRKISIYLSLNGLSAIRRCLAAYAPCGLDYIYSIQSDKDLLKAVPSWRCSKLDLQGSPFDPLSNPGDWSIDAESPDHSIAPDSRR